jgi:hypothetical protein
MVALKKCITTTRLIIELIVARKLSSINKIHRHVKKKFTPCEMIENMILSIWENP